MRIASIRAEPFPIALKEPFTISRASVDSTRAVLVRATMEADGEATGYGEAALPLGDPSQPADLTRAIEAVRDELVGAEVQDLDALSELLDLLSLGPVARSGLFSALADAYGRCCREPLYRLMAADAAEPAALTCDITLPIADPDHLAELARGYWAQGFRCFKIKVGADLASDQRTVSLVAEAAPEAAILFDANEGFTKEQAVALIDSTRALGLTITCFEQPCPRDDHHALRHVREARDVPVVADESVRSMADLEALHAAKAVDGINLKLVKMGGMDRCLTLGRRARALGLRLMVGAMIESRLGLTAMAHVVAALGGVEWVDLDTAFLLAEDPYRGGLICEGPQLRLPEGAGLAIEPLRRST